jgi:hypothetical protein
LTTSTSDEPQDRPPTEPDPDPDPLGTATRRAKQARRLPPDAACAICGETEPTTLIAVKRRKSPLEEHHAMGRHNEPEVVVVLCRNHHAKATDAQYAVGSLPDRPAPSPLERLPLALKSLGSFFELLAKSCYFWAGVLTAVIAALEAGVPGWRHLPGMP